MRSPCHPHPERHGTPGPSLDLGIAGGSTGVLPDTESSAKRKGQSHVYCGEKAATRLSRASQSPCSVNQRPAPNEPPGVPPNAECTRDRDSGSVGLGLEDLLVNWALT